MAADDIVACGACAPRAGLHQRLMSAARKRQHLARGVAVELAMEPANERAGCGLRQRTCGGEAIELGLHAHMRGGFDLEMAPRRVGVELSGERALDVARTRMRCPSIRLL